MSETRSIFSEQDRDEKLARLVPLAAEVYLFGYPLVAMELTRRAMTNTSKARIVQAPMNQFVHLHYFPDDSFAALKAPNADVLCSSAWLDLKEPMLLSVPDTGGRYYSLTVLDAWTEVVSSLGTRTTGNGRGDFILVGPSFKGTLPYSLTRIVSPTDLAWTRVRIQCNGEDDYDFVNGLQDRFKVIPYRDWGHKSLESLHEFVVKHEPRLPGRPLEAQTPVADQLDKMDVNSFYSLLCDLMMHNPPRLEDEHMVEKMAVFDIRPGEPLDPELWDSVQYAALEDGAKEAHGILSKPLGSRPADLANGYCRSLNIGRFNSDYTLRALVARSGPGARLPDDTMYFRTAIDSEGRPLVGKGRYVIHLARDLLPPTNAFWSLSMYDRKRLFVSNPLGRYAIGDRDDVRFGPDGSLDIFIQHEGPGKDNEPNWLPAPQDDFNLLFRLYWPKERVLRDEWAPPAPVRVS